MTQMYSYAETRRPGSETGCSYCLDPRETADLICFTELWRVKLHPKQAHLGACIVYPTRHAPKVSELTRAEFGEFQTIMARLERTLENAFGTVLLNYGCFMNYAFREADPNPPYQDGKPSPHVHWQIHPRYEHTVEFSGVQFEDPTFGAPYITGRDQTIGTEVRIAIRDRIVEGLDIEQLGIGWPDSNQTRWPIPSR